MAAAPGEVVRLFTSDKGGLTVYQIGPDGRTAVGPAAEVLFEVE